MPTKATVDAFTAQVISGDHIGAIRDWYHEDAWMQENQAPPRQGREALLKQETAMMERSQSVTTELLGGPLIQGEQVAIRWRFTFVFKDGGRMQQEEVAWQTWRGEKVATETFFYDPSRRGG